MKKISVVIKKSWRFDELHEPTRGFIVFHHTLFCLNIFAQKWSYLALLHYSSTNCGLANWWISPTYTLNIADTKHVLVTQIGLDQIWPDLWLWIWLIWSEKGHKGPQIDQNQPLVITLNYPCESGGSLHPLLVWLLLFYKLIISSCY